MSTLVVADYLGKKIQDSYKRSRCACGDDLQTAGAHTQGRLGPRTLERRSRAYRTFYTTGTLLDLPSSLAHKNYTPNRFCFSPPKCLCVTPKSILPPPNSRSPDFYSQRSHLTKRTVGYISFLLSHLHTNMTVELPAWLPRMHR